MDGFSQACLEEGLFSELKPKISQRYRLRLLNQCLNGVFTCHWLLACTILWFFPQKRNLMQWNCQKLHTFFNRLYKQTWFFSKQTSQFLRSRSHSSNFYLENVGQYNERVSGKCHYVSHFLYRCSQKLEVIWFLQENKPALLKDYRLHFVHGGIGRFITFKNRHKIQLLRSVHRNTIMIGGKGQKRIFSGFNLVNIFGPFQKTGAISHILLLINNFSLAEHHLNLHTNVLGYFFNFGNIKNWNGHWKFSKILPSITPIVLQNCRLHFFDQRMKRQFFTFKGFLDGPTMHLLPCNGKLFGQTSQKWKFVWLVLIFNFGFSQSTCQDFFHQSLKHQLCFCTKWLSIDIFFLILCLNIWWA